MLEVDSACRFMRYFARAILHSCSSSKMLEEIPGCIFLPSAVATRGKMNSAQSSHKIKQEVANKLILLLLKEEASPAIFAIDVGMDICLWWAWASKDLVSSLSFLSLTITQHRALCCNKTQMDSKGICQAKNPYQANKQ